MADLLLSRRSFLMASAVGTSSLVLAGCDQFDFLGQRDHHVRNVLERANSLTYQAQRLLAGQVQRPAQAKLQLDLIRANLAEESRWAGTVRGVFGNAQQPLMVLPNIRFFAQAARNPAYRSATDEQILRDLAEALGGPADLLVPAWQCMTLPLDRLPAYPAGRSVTLKSSPRRLRASGASSCRRASRRKIGTGAN